MSENKIREISQETEAPPKKTGKEEEKNQKIRGQFSKFNIQIKGVLKKQNKENEERKLFKKHKHFK